jgi:hypothetical protein
MKNIEYLVYSINSLDSIYEGKMIKCLRAFAEEGSNTIELCEFLGNKFLPIFEVRTKEVRDRSVIEIFLQERFRYDKLEKVLRRHHVRGDYKRGLQFSFAFVLKKIDEIKI